MCVVYADANSYIYLLFQVYKEYTVSIAYDMVNSRQKNVSLLLILWFRINLSLL